MGCFEQLQVGKSNYKVIPLSESHKYSLKYVFIAQQLYQLFVLYLLVYCFYI